MDTSFERSDASEDWITPPEIVAALGAFDLDPCACEEQFKHYAPMIYTKRQNGLLQPWLGRVWCNPPYGRAADAFIKKLSEHGNGVLLIFARTETRTWFEHIWPKAHGILFLKGRLRFYRPDGVRGDSAGAPSALIAYGGGNAKVLQSLDGRLGKYVELRGD
jgi:hypothetical protein